LISPLRFAVRNTLRVRKGEGQSTQPTAKEAPEEETHLDGVDLALELAGLVGGDRGVRLSHCIATGEEVLIDLASPVRGA
jgi:hypothetical protein